MHFDPQTHRKRCHRFNLPRHCHSLTFSCFRRQPFLSRDRARQWLAAAIESARTTHAFLVYAWVFILEHAHLLLQPERDVYGISAILAGIKLPVTIRAHSWVLANAPTFLCHMLDQQPNGKRTVRFWQRGGGYDRNIFTADELWEKIHYIHQNPVRRGLVARGGLGMVQCERLCAPASRPHPRRFPKFALNMVSK